MNCLLNRGYQKSMPGKKDRG